ncbi:phytanoyl-coa dioxygenase 1-like [Plakobranchus ocellatus]|uniref:Phytanoyl-coa dioxygenase 1-like n=1 Tax=Plakobranchus ocellatus TaxID=259542 RepID=A0AAV3Y901_9GAST|nr:phytanoyl-coa dioxygenase 1-like [Plakobranchus ocellatus]
MSNESYDHMIASAWIPFLDATPENGCLQVAREKSGRGTIKSVGFEFFIKPDHNKVISSFRNLRQAKTLAAGLELATEGSPEISGRIRYPLCHRCPHKGAGQRWTSVRQGRRPRVLCWADLVHHATRGEHEGHSREGRRPRVLFWADLVHHATRGEHVRHSRLVEMILTLCHVLLRRSPSPSAVLGRPYIMLYENMRDTLGVDLKRDIVTEPVPYGGFVLFNNLIPHRSLPNLSDEIRWSVDLRWQSPRFNYGFYDIQEGILFRSPNQPNLVPDWDKFFSVDRKEVWRKKYAKALSDEKDDGQFDTRITGPWIGKWETVNHNAHTDLFQQMTA